MGANGMQQTKKTFFTKLPAKYAAWIMPLLLSGLMSAALSLVNSLMNVGLIDGLAVNMAVFMVDGLSCRSHVFAYCSTLNKPYCGNATTLIYQAVE